MIFNIPRMIFSIIFPGTEVRATGLVPCIFPRALLVNWNNTGFQSPGTSSDSQDLWQMIEWDPAITSASSFSTWGWIPSGPMDLRTFSWCNWFLTISVSTSGKPLLPHLWSSDSEAWVTQDLLVLLRTEEKNQHWLPPLLIHPYVPGDYLQQIVTQCFPWKSPRKCPPLSINIL